MQVCTRSKPITDAIARVLWRMPPKDRKAVERFVSRVTAERAWTPAGIAGFDPTAALLAPLWRAGDRANSDTRARGVLHWEGFRARHHAQVCFNLPIVRLFSDKALLGIVAHEFAHARMAARLGVCWHEKMKARVQCHERAADRLAASWGFAKEISLMRKERDERVSHLLYSREREIRSRNECRTGQARAS